MSSPQREFKATLAYMRSCLKKNKQIKTRKKEWLLKKQNKNEGTWNWRNDSTIKSTCCTPRGLEFKSQNPWQTAHNTCNSGFRRRYLWPLRSPVLTYTYSHADTHTYDLKIITNQPLIGKLMSPVHISSCGSIRNGCCPKRITFKGKMIPEGDRRPLKKTKYLESREKWKKHQWGLLRRERL